MGTPLPPVPIEPGVPCSVCWGPDGPFKLPTPLKVFMALHGWNEGTTFSESYRTQLESIQELTQNVLEPCEWAAATPNFGWFLQFAPGGTFMQVEPAFPIVGGAFFQTVVDLCQQTLTNGIVSPVDNVIYGGTASVYFGSPP